MAFTYDSSDGSGPSSNVVGTVVRSGAAVAILVSGLVHLQLYFDGYRDFPNANLGRSFLANAIGSALIACVLVVRRDVLVRLAGAGLLVSTLIAFWLSRTDSGIFGFTESGLQPSPQAALALVADIAGLALLAATFVPAIGAGDDLRPAAALPVAAAVLIVSVGGGALWARSPSEPSQTGPTDSAPANPTSPSVAPTSAPPDSTAAADTTDPVSTETSESTRRGRDRPTATPTTVPPTAQAPTTVPPTTEPPAAPEVATITIADFSFEPDTMEIPAGTTVEWVNEDSFAHTVEADDDSFASENLDNGDTFSFEFTEPGTYDYLCGIHPSMTATIIVTG